MRLAATLLTPPSFSPGGGDGGDAGGVDADNDVMVITKLMVMMTLTTTTLTMTVSPAPLALTWEGVEGTCQGSSRKETCKKKGIADVHEILLFCFEV